MLLYPLVLVFGLILWKWLKRSRKPFPPGPFGLPIVGHLPLLGRQGHVTLMKWKETYGPIIGIRLGSFRAVALQDAKLIREAMKLDGLTGRPMEIMLDDFHGISVSSGKRLQEQRNFFLKSLRTFCHEKRLEAKIVDEVTELRQNLASTAGNPIEIRHAFSIPIFSSFYSILFGEKIPGTDPETLEVLHALSSALSNFHPMSGLTMLVPWLKHIFPERLNIKQVFGNLVKITETYVQHKLDNHKVQYVEGEPQNIVDAYRDKVRTTTDETSSFHPKHYHMVHGLSEIILGTLDGVTPTLKWICLYLLHYPDVQEKLQKAIDDVVGPNRLPSLADRQDLDYMNAVIQEVMRHSSAIGLGFPRSAIEDVDFQGYQIPKGTIVIGNFYSVHHDKGIWGDPQNFRPERFLDPKGKFVGNQNVFAFGAGKRACLGENIGMDNVFLFTTSLLQVFTFKAAGKLPEMDPVCGLGLFPPDFDILFVNRNRDQLN